MGRGFAIRLSAAAFTALLAGVLVALLAALGGCVAEDIDEACPKPAPPDPPAGEEKMLYHEGIASWIRPQGDPYDLKNWQAAIDRLASRGVVRAETARATHYALRIFPRSEDEQWSVEQMEDVRVSYIPFTYVALTEQEAGEVTTLPEDALFEEEGTSTVEYEGTSIADPAPDGPDGGGIFEGDVTYEIPVLYAVWPVDKELPDYLDYLMDYEVFLPDAAGATRSGRLNAQCLVMIEDEAISFALGRPSTRAPRTRADATLSGECRDWEVLTNLRVPVPRVKVRFHLGSNVVEVDADGNGRFGIAASRVPAGASWELVFQNSKWKVTREGSTVPKSFFQGDVYQDNFWADESNVVGIDFTPLDATILKALNYYYYGNHGLKKWEYDGGIRVISNSNSNGSYNGLFTYSGSTCFITYYRNNSGNNRNILMGTVFHELGHFIHFNESGGSYSAFTMVDRFLQESFASWVGWSLTQKYFAELGYVPDAGRDISGQSRQTSWVRTTTSDWGYYSPLFVDLEDTYNQSLIGSNYNDDRVKDVHYSVMMQVAADADTWEECKAILRREVTGQDQDLDAFFAPYDYWYANRSAY